MPTVHRHQRHLHAPARTAPSLVDQLKRDGYHVLHLDQLTCAQRIDLELAAITAGGILLTATFALIAKHAVPTVQALQIPTQLASDTAIRSVITGLPTAALLALAAEKAGLDKNQDVTMYV